MQNGEGRLTKERLNHLLRAMEADGMSFFWIELVAAQGPRGTAIGDVLYLTMPDWYQGLR